MLIGGYQLTLQFPPFCLYFSLTAPHLLPSFLYNFHSPASARIPMDQCWVRSLTPLLWFVRVLASARLPFHSHVECVAAFNPSRFGACRAGLNIRGRVLRSAALKSTGAAHPSRRNPCAHGRHRDPRRVRCSWNPHRLSMEVTRAPAAADSQSLVSSDVLASNIVSYNGYCPRCLGLDGLESSFRRPQSQHRSQGARPPPTSSIAAPKGSLSTAIVAILGVAPTIANF